MFLVYIDNICGYLATIMISRIEELEPALNLNNLFYKNEVIKEEFKKELNENPRSAKYDNFKLLTDIQNVLEKCRHLTSKDKLLYCQSQRYFMKQYLREINKQ